MSTMSLADLFQQYQKEDEIFVADEGDYELEVIRASKRGDNAVMPVFKILAGPHAGKTVMAGQMTLTEKSRSIFFRQLSGFGLGADFFQRGPSFEDIANALVGRVVSVHLTQDEWPKGSGEYRNKLPIGGIKLLRVNSGATPPVAGPGPAGPPPAPVQAAPPAPPQQVPQTAPAAPPAQPPQPPQAPPVAPPPPEQAAPPVQAPAAPPAPPVEQTPAQPAAAPAAPPVAPPAAPQAAPVGPPPVPAAPGVPVPPGGGQPF